MDSLPPYSYPSYLNANLTPIAPARSRTFDPIAIMPASTPPTPSTPSSASLITSALRPQPPKRPYTRSETPEPDTNPALKRQSTESTNYSDLLHLYEKIKQVVSIKYTLPGQEETPAPWVVEVLKMLDDAETMDENHQKAVESVEKDIICLAAVLEKMGECTPVRVAVSSTKALVKVHSHDVEGKRIVERRIGDFERSLGRE